MGFRTIALAATTILILSTSAKAAVIEWDLYNVQFDDGGTAFGSFFYDADTNIFSNIDITTTTGTTFTGTYYEFMNPDITPYADSLHLTATPGTADGTRAFNINLVSIMTNAGGAISLLTPPAPTSFEGLCSGPICNSFKPAPDNRLVISGWVSTSASITPVPIPAAVWLFGSGLLGLIGVARRKKA